MHKFKKSSAVLAVFSSLMLLVALVVPVFADSITLRLTYPSSYTGKAAGTSQTGIPYSTVSFANGSGSVTTSSYNGNTSSLPYSTRISFELASSLDDFTLTLSLVEPVTFNSGYEYVVRFYLFADNRNSSWQQISSQVTCQVNVGSMLLKTVSLPSSTLKPVEFSFVADKTYSASTVVLRVDGADLSTWNGYIGWFKVLEKNPYADVVSQVGGKIDNQTDNILNGDGLNGTSGVNDNQLNGAIAGQDDAQDKINDALGNPDAASQLDAAMNVQLDDNIKSSFSFINSLFSRVVTTLDISVVLTFLLVFALAMYVVGRRTS